MAGGDLSVDEPVELKMSGEGQQRTEDLLTQHRRVHYRAWLRRVRLAAGPAISQARHDCIGDGVFVDGIGDGVGKDVYEVVGVQSAWIDASANGLIIEDGEGDGSHVYAVMGMADGCRYISLVRGVHASVGHGLC